MRDKRIFGLMKKFILGFAILATLLCVILSVVTTLTYRRDFEKQYKDYAFLSAGMISDIIDGDRALTYINGAEKDEYYNKIYDYLSDVMTLKDIRYAYIFVPGVKDGKKGGIYIWNIPAADEIAGSEHEPGFFSEFWDTSEYSSANIIQKTYDTGSIIDDAYITNSSDGYIASVYTPIFASDGSVAAICGIDINMNNITGRLRSFVITLIVLIILIVLVFFAVYLLFLSKTLIGPINKLTSKELGFASGGKLADVGEPVRTGDEIELLYEAFKSMAADISTYSDNLAASAADRERVSTELSVAKNIQLSMLPSTQSVLKGHPQFGIYAEMHPAKLVGGDFYDFFMINENTLGICIADISGKGISAALMMVITKTLIRYHMQSGEKLSEVLSTVNMQLCENNTDGLYVTALCATLELDTGRFTYVSAGHNAPMLMRSGERYDKLPMKTGFVLAAFENVTFREAEITLRQGDRIFLTTAGLCETEHDGEIFGEQSLLTALNASCRSQVPLEVLTSAVCDAAIEFAYGGEVSDDITALALEYRKGGREMREIVFSPSAGELDRALKLIHEQLDENGISEAFTSRSVIIAEAAFMSIAGSQSDTAGKITLVCTVGSVPPEISFKYTFGGEICDITQNADPISALLRRQCDSMEYSFENSQNVILIKKKL